MYRTMSIVEDDGATEDTPECRGIGTTVEEQFPEYTFYWKHDALSVMENMAPPPEKDHVRLTVTFSEVIFRFWKISLRKNGAANPLEIRESHEDFLYDERLQSEIMRLFGANMMTYVRGLASGHIDYVVRLPEKVLIHIVGFLELEDIQRLAITCKRFNKICNSDGLWEHIFTNYTNQSVTDELRSLGEAVGWKKLFFTNRLQLQMQIRRMGFLQNPEASSIASEGEDLWDLRPASIMSMHSMCHFLALQKTRQSAMMKRKRRDHLHEDGFFDFDISPYPEGQYWPKFQGGPQDYSKNTILHPRNEHSSKLLCEQETDKEEIATIKKILKKRAKIPDDTPQLLNSEEWGEDLSFLSKNSYAKIVA